MLHQCEENWLSCFHIKAAARQQKRQNYNCIIPDFSLLLKMKDTF